MTKTTRKIYDRNNLPPKQETECKGEDWNDTCEQEFEQEVNINKIIEKYNITKSLPLKAEEPLYIDTTLIPQTPLEALNQVEVIEEYFSGLNSTVRNYFNNDPKQFMQRLTDENVQQDLIQMNILNERKNTNEQIERSNTSNKVLDNGNAAIDEVN